MTKDTQLNKWPHGQIYCKHAKCFNHLYYVNTRFIHSFDTLIPLSNSQTSGLQFISFSRIDSLIEFRILTEIPDDRALNLAEFQARYLCDTANTIKAQICTITARPCVTPAHAILLSMTIPLLLLLTVYFVLLLIQLALSTTQWSRTVKSILKHGIHYSTRQHTDTTLVYVDLFTFSGGVLR